MNLFRIVVGLLLALFALSLIFLIRNVQLPTGKFVLITSGITGVILGLLSIFTLYRFVSSKRIQIGEKRKRKPKLSEEDIIEEFEKELIDVKPNYLENRLVLRAGSIAAYLKKRGKYMGGISRRGQYIEYEIWARGLKKEAERILKRHPKLSKSSYLLNFLSKIDEYQLGDLLEKFGYLYETVKRLKLEYVPKKYLKDLSKDLKALV